MWFAALCKFLIPSLLSRILSSKSPENEMLEASLDVTSSAMWIGIYMYKLYSICYCIHITADEVWHISIWATKFLIGIFYTPTWEGHESWSLSACVWPSHKQPEREVPGEWKSFNQPQSRKFVFLSPFFRSKCSSSSSCSSRSSSRLTACLTLIWGFLAWWARVQPGTGLFGSLFLVYFLARSPERW